VRRKQVNLLRNAFTLSQSVIDKISHDLGEEVGYTHIGLYQRKSKENFLDEEDKVDLFSQRPMRDIRHHAFIFNHIDLFKATDGSEFQAFVYQDAATESDIDVDDVIDSIRYSVPVGELRNAGGVPLSGFISEIFRNQAEIRTLYVRSIREIKYIYMRFHDVLEHSIDVENVTPQAKSGTPVVLKTPFALSVGEEKNILAKNHYHALLKPRIREPASSDSNPLFFLPHIRTYNTLNWQITSLFYSYRGRIIRISLRRDGGLDKPTYSFDFSVTPRLVVKGAFDDPGKYMEGKQAIIFSPPLIETDRTISAEAQLDPIHLNKLAFIYQSVILGDTSGTLPYSDLIRLVKGDLSQTQAYVVSHAFTDDSEIYDYFCARLKPNVIVGNMYPLYRRQDNESVHQATANKDYLSALIFRTLAEKERDYGLILERCSGSVDVLPKITMVKPDIKSGGPESHMAALGYKPRGMRHFFFDDHAFTNLQLSEADILRYWTDQHERRSLTLLPINDKTNRLNIYQGNEIASGDGDHEPLETLVYILLKCLSLSIGNIVQFYNQKRDIDTTPQYIRMSIDAQLNRKRLCDRNASQGGRIIDYRPSDYGISNRSKAIFFDNRHADSSRKGNHGVYIEVLSIDQFTRDGSIQLFDALHSEEKGLMRELMNKDARLREEIRDLILDGDEMTYLFLIFDGNFNSWRNAKQLREDLIQCLGDMNVDVAAFAHKIIIAFIPKNTRTLIFNPHAGQTEAGGDQAGILVCRIEPNVAYVSFNTKRAMALQQKPYEVRLPDGEESTENLDKVLRLLKLLHAKEMVLPAPFLDIKDHAIIHAIDKVTQRAAMAERWITKQNEAVIRTLVHLLSDATHTGETLSPEEKAQRHEILTTFRNDLDAHFANPSVNNLFIRSVNRFAQKKNRGGSIKLTLFM
jgi:hypothetical protein